MKWIKSMSMMIIFILIYVNAFVVFGSNVAPNVAPKVAIEVIKSATEYDYPPFSVTDNGKADGFSVELLKAVIHEIGLDIEFKVDQWQTIKDELENGQLDVLPLVGYNEERDTYFDFSVPYIIMRGNIFIRNEDDQLITSEVDLEDKTLIVMAGDNAQEYAVSKGWSNNLVLVETYVEAFKLLNSGKYDAVIAQGLVGEKIINDLGLKNIVAVYTYDEINQKRIKVQLSGFEQKFCFAVEEGNKELLARLNEGLAIVSANGTYDRLYTKWFPFLVDTKPTWIQIVIAASAIVIPILIALLIVSYFTIRKQVKDKTAYLEAQSNEIKYISYHDSLTGLFNRRYFDEELIRLDDPRYYPLTLLVTDLNGLKIVNDTLGHLAGDQTIIAAANILKEACRETDVVSRWGGDEFVCIFPNADEASVLTIIDRIKKLSKANISEYGELSLAFGFETKDRFDQSIHELFKVAEENMYKNKLSESEGARGNMVRTILNALFEKSPLDKEHSERVSKLGVDLAHAMAIKASVVSDIRNIGLLHDIGKIVVPQSLLEKVDKLDNDDWLQIKQHPAIGYRVLSTCNEFAHIAKGVLYHHERVDGKGYQEGLFGDQIPIESRIIAVVDAFDAMTAFRPYKKYLLSDKEAATELKRNINTQFDESIVKCFVEDVLKFNWESLK